MDWADDVAYSVHDVEDGIHGGYVSLRPAARRRRRAGRAVRRRGRRRYSGEPADDLAAVLDELLADPVLAAVAGYDGSHRAQAALKRMTSVLTGRFVAAAVERDAGARTAAAPLRRYAADLVVPPRGAGAVRAAEGHRAAVRDAPAGRAAAATSGSGRSLPSWWRRWRRGRRTALDPVFAPLWRAAADDAARLRVVIDQVASLTDPAAVAWHARVIADDRHGHAEPERRPHVPGGDAAPRHAAPGDAGSPPRPAARAST